MNEKLGHKYLDLDLDGWRRALNLSAQYPASFGANDIIAIFAHTHFLTSHLRATERRRAAIQQRLWYDKDWLYMYV